jgi:hypothetical protein
MKKHMRSLASSKIEMLAFTYRTEQDVTSTELRWE